MEDDASAPSDAKDSEFEETPPFRQVGNSFRHSMDAVIELHRFAAQHVHQLDDFKASIIDHASKNLPQATPEQHDRAVDLVIDMFSSMGITLSDHLEVTIHPTNDAQAKTSPAEDPGSDLSVDDHKGQAAGSQLAEPTVWSTAQELVTEILPGNRGFLYYVLAFMTARARPKREAVLYASLLTTAVGNFEVFISGMVRDFLRIKPEAIRSDDARYSLSEIEGYETLEEFRAYCAERYAENLLRGGLEDWLDWFDKRLKVSVSDVTEEIAALREVFQRRHLLVHNGGRVNRLYLNKMKGVSDLPDLGSKLEVDDNYLVTSVDRLLAAGTLLQAAVMRRLLPVDEDGDHPAEGVVSSAIYDALQSGRWLLARELANAVKSEWKSEEARLINQVNLWIAKKELEGLDSIKSEVGRWEVGPLSARYKLAKIALLEQHADAVELAFKLISLGDLGLDDWFTWPLLAGARSYAVSEGLSPQPAA